MERVSQSLKERGITLESSSVDKIVALSTDLGQLDLGLSQEIMERFKTEVSLIFHLAWPVNFSIHLQSFEPHLAGLRTLLKLSIDVYRSEPASFFFASSISTAENTPPPALIADAPINDFSQALDMGYAQSKLVGEHMVLNAARRGARSYVLRIGQIVGDLQSGFWNDNEYVPSMIRSALSMKALPALNENCSWIPVDTLATAILEVSRTVQSAPNPCAIDSMNPPVIYNMCNPQRFSWDQLLEEVRKAGVEFETVPYGDWMHLLRDSASNGEEEQNPAVKLLDHFELRYSMSMDKSKSDSDGVETDDVNDDDNKVNGAGNKEKSSIKVDDSQVDDTNTQPKEDSSSSIGGTSAMMTPLKLTEDNPKPNAHNIEGTATPSSTNTTTVATPSDSTTSLDSASTSTSTTSSLNSATENDFENENKSRRNYENKNKNLLGDGVTFDTAAVLRDSEILRHHPPNIIEDGYVRKFMEKWLERWGVS